MYFEILRLILVSEVRIGRPLIFIKEPPHTIGITYPRQKTVKN